MRIAVTLETSMGSLASKKVFQVDLSLEAHWPPQVYSSISPLVVSSAALAVSRLEPDSYSQHSPSPMGLRVSSTSPAVMSPCTMSAVSRRTPWVLSKSMSISQSPCATS